jgi:hypothetical protein
MASFVADLLEKGVSKLGGEEAGQMFAKSTRSMGHTFDQTPVGKYTRSLLENYRQATDQAVSQIAPTVPAGTFSGNIKGQAKAIARAQTFGQDDKALTALMKISHQKYGQAYTENLMDHVAMVLHEDEEFGGHEHVSRFKANARTAIGSLPEFQKNEEGIAKRNPYTVTSDYHKQGTVERYVTNFIYSRFSPLIAIPHLGTALNVSLSTQTMAWGRALAETMSRQTPQQLKQTLLDGGVMAEGALRNIRNAENIRNGIITKHLPGSFQDVLSKVTSTPGFNYLRDWQTSFAGSASYYDAISYAEQHAKSPGDKLIAKRLEQYGMTPKDLAAIKMTGKLTQDQLERAVYHGVNRKIFLDTTFARSYNAQSNGFTRAFSMYHGYVSRQAQFLGEELRTSVLSDTRSIGGAAKFLATVGVVFPVAGEALKIGEMVGRGQWNQIGAEVNNDYEDITYQHGDTEAEKLEHFIGTWAEAQASLGSFGIAWGLIQGAHRGALAAQMAGPIWGNGFKYIQDIWNFGEKAGFDLDSPSAKPFRRDVLTLTLPVGLGRYAAHAVLPSKREERLAKGDNKFKKLKGLSHFKKLSSLN